jgi:lipopolysaccharide transport system permease protein
MKKLLNRLTVFLRYRELFFLLIEKDIKLKYRRSVLGYFWSILNPLMIMTVMTIVFSTMFRFNIEHYAVYLLIGNLLFSFLQNSSGRAMGSIIDSAALIKKTYVPKYIFTLSAVTSELVNLFFALIALLIVMLVTHVQFTWYFFLIIIPIFELYVFCVGVGLFLAQAAVFFRDIQYIWSVICMAWLYLTPIFYPIELLPDTLRWFITTFNPMYFYLSAFRGFALYGDNVEWTLSPLYGALTAVVFLILGTWSFSLNKNKFILYI